MHLIELMDADGNVIDDREHSTHDAAALDYIHTLLGSPAIHIRWSEHGLPGMPVITVAERFGRPQPIEAEIGAPSRDDEEDWRNAVDHRETNLGLHAWLFARTTARLHEGHLP